SPRDLLIPWSSPRDRAGSLGRHGRRCFLLDNPSPPGAGRAAGNVAHADTGPDGRSRSGHKTKGGHMDRAVATSLHARRRLTVLACTALLLALPTAGEARKEKRFRTATRSSTIRITKNDKLVVAVNREANSLAVLPGRK